MANTPIGNGVFGPVTGEPDPSATSQATANTGGATVTREQFATAILTKLGYPQTPQNIAFLVAWMNREGTAAAYNPLATKLKYNGSYDLPGNSPGDPLKVQQYQSFDDGVAATVKTLLNGYYPDILAGLKSGDAQTAGANGQMERGLLKWSGAGYSSIGGNADPNAAISTGGTGGSASSSGGTQLSGQALTDYAESNFPQYAYLLNDPEVGPILVKAAQQGVTDPNILLGMLRNTHWYTTTSSTARSFNELMADDPATANQAITNQINAIHVQATQMGVDLSDQAIHDLALNYMKLGWTPGQLTQQLATYAKYQGDITYKGQAGVDVQQLKDLYASYALPASDQTLNSQLQLLLGGTQTLDEFKQGVAQKAKSLYGSNPDLGAALDRGETVDQAMSSYADLAATLTGTDPGQINWLDPKWNVALTGTTDPKTGQTTGMSMAQWGRTLRSDPIYGYDGSENAVSTASQFATQLLAKMTGAS